MLASEHKLKHHPGIFLMQLEREIHESDLQPSNAQRLIFLTLSGIIIFWSDEQLKKAFWQISITLSGIVTFISEEQLKKAQSQILVTVFGIVTFVID